MMSRSRKPDRFPTRHIRLKDLLAEAWTSVAAQGPKSLITAAGTVVATAAFIAMSGIGSTLSQQVTEDFDSLRATQLTATLAKGATAKDWFDQRALDRVERLPGVASAGILTGSAPAVATRMTTGVRIKIEARGVDARALASLGIRLRSGRIFDNFHVRESTPVVVLPEGLAERLGIAAAGDSVDIDGKARTVIGVYSESSRMPELMVQAILPLDFDSTPSFDPLGTQVFITTQGAAAHAIAPIIPTALRPASPAEIVVATPVSPERFRRSIEQNVRRFTLGAVLVALLLSSVSIASAASSAMIARTSEIGLRVAIGAKPRHVLAQLLLESTGVGLAGGLSGAVIGLLTVIGSAAWLGVPPMVDAQVTITAVLAAMGAGLLAGAGPAIRAMRIEPVDALRR